MSIRLPSEDELAAWRERQRQRTLALDLERIRKAMEPAWSALVPRVEEPWTEDPMPSYD